MPIAEIESIFDSIFAPKVDDLNRTNLAPAMNQQVQVQLYGSDKDM
jgi:hypothetical protein